MFYCKGVGSLDIRQLEYFVELAKTRNFRKASEHLHLSQPALSKSIRLLETELNTVVYSKIKVPQIGK